MTQTLKIFLVELDAVVYDNDTNYIVLAKSAEEATRIIREEFDYVAKYAKTITAQELEVGKTKKSNWKEVRPDGAGVLHEYSPHAGDPELGD